MSIREPYEVEDAMLGLGDAVADLLKAHDTPELIGKTIRETMSRFCLMYRTLYEMETRSGMDWSGFPAQARETLEKVNEL